MALGDNIMGSVHLCIGVTLYFAEIPIEVASEHLPFRESVACSLVGEAEGENLEETLVFTV